ncbi:MAG: SPOR domain-containing protein, partial [Pseudomonas sp.]|nr:SPOR domain-containing protein [Pseudomonas sp.]
LMVFIRPSVVRDAAGLHNLSQLKYQDIRVLGGANEGLSPLPINPQQLFDRGAATSPELDLRPSSSGAQAFPAASHTLLEKAKIVDPATLGNGRGGDELPPARPAPTRVPVVAKVPAVPNAAPVPRPNNPAQRYSIELLNGSNEAYMQALLKQHPNQPLHLAREQRDGQPWFRILYGNYPDQPLAERVLRTVPAALPQRRAKVVPL